MGGFEGGRRRNSGWVSESVSMGEGEREGWDGIHNSVHMSCTCI